MLRQIDRLSHGKHFDWKSLLNSITNALMQSAIATPESQGFAGTLNNAARDFMGGTLNALVSNAIMGAPIELDNILAEMAGQAIGRGIANHAQPIVHQIKQDVQNWHDRKLVHPNLSYSFSDSHHDLERKAHMAGLGNTAANDPVFDKVERTHEEFFHDLDLEFDAETGLVLGDYHQAAVHDPNATHQARAYKNNPHQNTTEGDKAHRTIIEEHAKSQPEAEKHHPSVANSRFGFFGNKGPLRREYLVPEIDLTYSNEPVTKWDVVEGANLASAHTRDFISHPIRALGNTLNSAWNFIKHPSHFMQSTTSQAMHLATAYTFGSNSEKIGLGLGFIGDAIYVSALGAGLGEIAVPTITKGASRVHRFFINDVPNKIPINSFKPGEAAAHFEKHGAEISSKFGFSSYTKEQYIHDANHVIQHGQFVPELNGYVLTPSGKGSALAPFVGLDRATGEITTLHLKPVSFFERKAPSLGWSAKPRSEITDTIGANRELGYRSPYRSTF